MTGPRRPRSLGLGVSVALFALLVLGAALPFAPPGGADIGAPALSSTIERQAGADMEGPSIRNVRALPPLVRPGETVSLGAVITDPSGVAMAWVHVEGPGVTLNLTMVPFGNGWFLNRTWESPGGYAFEIGAQDGVGNVNRAAGRFQVQDSLAGAFGLLAFWGTLLAIGSAVLVVLWYRRKSARES